MSINVPTRPALHEELIELLRHRGNRLLRVSEIHERLGDSDVTREQLERAVEEAEAALAALEEELADPGRWATKYESEKSQARHTAAKRAVEAAYAALEAFEAGAAATA